MPIKDPDKRRAYARKFYAKNAKRISKKQAVRNNERRKMLRETVEAYKKNHPCIDCGEDEAPPSAMHFDHVPGRGDKVKDINRMVHSCVSVATLLAEIAKCDLVCAICHAIRTDKRRKENGPSSGS